MEQIVTSHLTFERSRLAMAIAAGSAAVMLADGISIAVLHDPVDTRIVAEPVSESLPDTLASDTNHRIQPRKILDVPEVAKALSAKVSPVTYRGALLLAHGNLVKAESILINLSIPPMLPAQAVDLSRQLHFKPPTEQQQLTAANSIRIWSKQVEARHLQPKTTRATAELFKSYTPAQEEHVRQQLVDAFYAELKQQVRETVVATIPGGKKVASNSGPRIDVYTDGHPENWCADFISFLFKRVNLPLNGGATYKGMNRPDWQILRVHQNQDIHKHPEYMSLVTWFRTNAFLFSKTERVPGPGDLVFIKRPDSKGRMDPAHAQWHVEMVLAKPKNGQLLAGGGNTTDSVRTQPFDYLNDPDIVAFGSLFPAL